MLKGAHGKAVSSILDVHGQIWTASHDGSIHVWVQQVGLTILALVTINLFYIRKDRCSWQQNC